MRSERRRFDKVLARLAELVQQTRKGLGRAQDAKSRLPDHKELIESAAWLAGKLEDLGSRSGRVPSSDNGRANRRLPHDPEESHRSTAAPPPNSETLENAWMRRRLLACRKEISDLRKENKDLKKASDALDQWISLLDSDLDALVRSRRWRIGNALVDVARRMAFKKDSPTAADHIRLVLERVRLWRSARGPSFSAAQESARPPSRPAIVLKSPPPTVDVLVCVHNALPDVNRCLASVLDDRSYPFRLILVNDASAEETAHRLRRLASQDIRITLIEQPPPARGYASSANRALQASSGDYAVLLNSDTVVPRGWLRRLIECAESDPRIGIVGPVSNAASWQSLPHRFEPGGDWAVNAIPDGLSVDEVARLLDSISLRKFPRLPLLNGFCLAIKRAVIEQIGVFDASMFANYGEENDYCIRARRAGFQLALADHAYVFHAKSRSYRPKRRRPMTKRATLNLLRKHPDEDLDELTGHLRRDATLLRLRRGMRDLLPAESPGHQNGQMPRSRTCRLIIPAYGQDLASVKRCLNAVLNCSPRKMTIVLVHAGLPHFAAEQLKGLAENNARLELRQWAEDSLPELVLLSHSGGDLIFLSPHVLVTPGWVDRLQRCSAGDGTAVRFVSPLIANSSYLGLRLNPGDTYLQAAEKLTALSKRRHPYVGSPHPDCFLLPEGVCRELRQVAAAGLEAGEGTGTGGLEAWIQRQASRLECRCRCADDVLLFSTRPRADEERTVCQPAEPAALEELRRRYGYLRDPDRLTLEEAAQRSCREPVDILQEPVLAETVRRFESLVQGNGDGQIWRGNRRVVFLIAYYRLYGGVISVQQLVNDLILQGIDAQIVVLSPKGFNRSLVSLTEPIVFRDWQSLVWSFPPSEVVVGTLWVTMYFLAQIVAHRGELKPCYYIQDYEPDFLDRSAESLRARVLRTYSMPALRFAKSDWLVDKIQQLGNSVCRVPPSLDLDLFYPREREIRAGRLVILAMLRPSSRRRGHRRALRVLSRIHQEYADGVAIETFGSSDDELAGIEIPFPFHNHGIVEQQGMPVLFSKADIFIEFSHFHAFGRTVAEAMACGTCCVVTDSGAVREFAHPGENCWMVDFADEDKVVADIGRIIRDDSLRNSLAGRAREAVLFMDRFDSARQIWRLLSQGPLETRPAGIGSLDCSAQCEIVKEGR